MDGWTTIFVVGQTELRPEHKYPPFSEGGSVMLYKTDSFDHSTIPTMYKIARVIFDVYGLKQYVHLGVFSDI
jgi:hypothetical protein